VLVLWASWLPSLLLPVWSALELLSGLLLLLLLLCVG
jgi:hypothetical protein